VNGLVMSMMHSKIANRCRSVSSCRTAQRGTITIDAALSLIVAMICIAALGLAAFETNGFGAWRLNAATASIDNLTALYQDESAKWLNPDAMTQCFQPPEQFVILNPDFFLQHGCLQRRAGKPAVLLMGDSHSASIGSGIRQWAKTQDMDFLQASGFLDPRLFCANQKIRKDLRACAPDYARAVMKTLTAAKPDVLVLDMYWAHPETLAGYPNMDAWAEQIQRAIPEIAADLGVKKVIIVGEIPTWQGNLPQLLLSRFVKKHQSIPRRTFIAVDPASLQMNEVLQKVTWPKNTEYFSIHDLLCNADGCLTRVGENLRTDLVVWDYGHLTEVASRYVAEHGLEERITQALKQ
jgi:hypothetical protein